MGIITRRVVGEGVVAGGARGVAGSETVRGGGCCRWRRRSRCRRRRRARIDREAGGDAVEGPGGERGGERGGMGGLRVGTGRRNMWL